MLLAILLVTPAMTRAVAQVRAMAREDERDGLPHGGKELHIALDEASLAGSVRWPLGALSAIATVVGTVRSSTGGGTGVLGVLLVVVGAATLSVRGGADVVGPELTSGRNEVQHGRGGRGVGRECGAGRQASSTRNRDWIEVRLEGREVEREERRRRRKVRHQERTRWKQARRTRRTRRTRRGRGGLAPIGR